MQVKCKQFQSYFEMSKHVLRYKASSVSKGLSDMGWWIEDQILQASLRGAIG